MLLVDAREKLLRVALESAGLSFTSRALAVGDVQYQRDGALAWIAERKTNDDLARSIKDGRWWGP